MGFNEFQLGQDATRLQQRLALIEEQLKELSAAVGVPYEDPADAAPAAVIELVKRGDRAGAIKLYRELTRASADDARAVVDSL